MKKLVLTEVIVAVLTIGIFTVLFTLIDGWSNELSVKYTAVLFGAVGAVTFIALSALAFNISNVLKTVVGLNAATFAAAFGAVATALSINTGAFTCTCTIISIVSFGLWTLGCGFATVLFGKKKIKRIKKFLGYYFLGSAGADNFQCSFSHNLALKIFNTQFLKASLVKQTMLLLF